MIKRNLKVCVTTCFGSKSDDGLDKSSVIHINKDV